MSRAALIWNELLVRNCSSRIWLMANSVWQILLAISYKADGVSGPCAIKRSEPYVYATCYPRDMGGKKC